MKNFSLKTDGKRLLCGLVASGIAMTSGGFTASAASSKKQTILESYNSRKNYGMKNPIEIMIPTNVTIDRKGNQHYNYTTVVLEFSKESINPTELISIIEGADKLNKIIGSEKFAYVDANETSFDKFKVNNARQYSDKKILMNYINTQDKMTREGKAKIDNSKYAEFWLPVLGNYSYRDKNDKKQTYRQLEYIWFYVPYSELSNKTDFSKLAEYVYARYQDGSFDHVVTWNEIKESKRKIK